MPDDEPELLHGGVANAGAVVRIGEHVLRPSNAHTPTIHRFLRRLADSGADVASVPIGVDADGRERLEFIAGDVPITPYPEWSQADESLASVAALIRRYHDAARLVPAEPDDSWSTEMVDVDVPAGADLVVCHNDVCLENVVFRDGRAVALLDFDFAAPGRPLHDLACFARMCVPVDDPDSRGRLGWGDVDVPARLRLVADAYGCDASGRAELVDLLDGTIQRGGQFVRRRVEAGEQAFIEMWERMGGQERFDRRRSWWSTVRPHIDDVLA